MPEIYNTNAVVSSSKCLSNDTGYVGQSWTTFTTMVQLEDMLHVHQTKKFCDKNSSKDSESQALKFA